MSMFGKINNQNNLILRNLIVNDEKKENQNDPQMFEQRAEERTEEFICTKVNASSLDILASINSALVNVNNDKTETNTLQQKLNELKIKLKNSVLAKNQNNEKVPEGLRYQYSEDFLDSVLNILESRLLQEENNLSPDEILSTFESQFYAAVGKTDLHYYQEVVVPGFPRDTASATQQEDIFGLHLSVKTLLLNLDKFTESPDIQVNIFANIFKNVFEELDLNSTEQELFLNKVIKKMFSKEVFKISDFEKLDQNGDKCWLEELYKIVQEEAGKIQKVDRNPKTIDVNELFKDSDNINAEYIIDNLDSLIFSNDAGTRKFAQMIYDLINKYDIGDNYDSEELVKSIIRLINNKYCNNPLQDYRYLSKQIIENLNNNDIFSVLQEICDSEDLYYQYMCESDGLINGFGQGSTSDCWLLAGLKSLCSSPIGQSIVQNSLTHNPDGSVTVTFKGMGGISYTISPEELMEAKGSGYAKGDNDVIIIELAIEKLHKDFISGKYKHPLCNDFDRDINTPREAINRGQQAWVYYYFTGLTTTTKKASNDNHDSILNWLHGISNDISNGNSVLSFTLYPNSSAKTIDGKAFSFDGDNGNAHAFAVVGMTDSTITIVNPWSSEETLTFTYEEFLKLNPIMHYLDLTP